MLKSKPLAGWSVVVTRPQHQAEHLCGLLAEAGAEPLRLPALAIEPLLPDESLQQRLTNLDRYDWAIFISANAIQHSLALIDRLPESLRLAVIGKSSRAALLAQGYDKVLMPKTGFDSEALLDLPELRRVNEQKIAIFRATGGRGKLADTLRQRGATVDYFEVYRRYQPTLNPERLLARWQASTPVIISVTSNAGLESIIAGLGKTAWPWLRRSPLATLSERARDYAHTCGWQAPVRVANGPSDEALIACIQRLASDHDTAYSNES